MKFAWGVVWIGLMLSIHADERFVAEARKVASTGLPYIYGADDPSRGGLDCSGFVDVVAKEAWGVSLPNEAGLQLEFARAHGKVWDKNSHDWNPQVLQPGDLVFWSGTRSTARANPVTHVMIYLGNGLVAGSQSKGQRVGLRGAGVGMYRFYPRNPLGDPTVKDDSIYRKGMTLYAYARLNPPDLQASNSVAQSGTQR